MKEVLEEERERLMLMLSVCLNMDES
jgi:hypothetical protein